MVTDLDTVPTFYRHHGLVTPQGGSKVTLQPCGVYSNSIWAADAPNATENDCSTGTAFQPRSDVIPLINGADAEFSNPLVLNYPAGNPTDMPRPQLNVQPEKSYSGGTCSTTSSGQYRGPGRLRRRPGLPDPGVVDRTTHDPEARAS